MLPDEAVIDWLFSASAWWIDSFGRVTETELVLPTDDHFDDPAPEAVLAQVAAYCGMDGWSFELDDERERVLDNPMPKTAPHPAFAAPVLRPEDDGAIAPGQPLPVPIGEEELGDAGVMVASFARALSHYLLYGARTPPPGGEELREHAVDLGAVMLGFGVFLANTAFDFRPVEQGFGMSGWSTQRRGAFDEVALGYQLAIFATLADADERVVLRHLSPNPKAAFKRARKDLARARTVELERLAQLEPGGVRSGPYR